MTDVRERKHVPKETIEVDKNTVILQILFSFLKNRSL